MSLPPAHDTRTRSRLGRWFGRYPVVRQYDQVDCGPAALLAVLKYWGGDASLVHVRELARTGAQGSSLLALVRAAESLGFQAKGAAGAYEDLARERMPCIAHLLLDDGRSHYVIVYRIDARGVLLGDPAVGRRRMARAEFERLWRSRSVMLLSPTDHLHTSRSPHWLLWIWGYFRSERTWLIQGLFLGAAATLLGLLTAVFIQWVIDRFIPEQDGGMILATGLVLLAMLFGRASAGYLRQRFVVRLNKRVGTRVNQDFLTHLFRLPLRFFDTRKTGDITARVADSVRIQNALLEMLGTAVIDGLIVLGSLGFLFVLAPPLALVALAAAPLYGALLIHATLRLKREQHEVMKSYAHVEASYIDSLDGVEAILGFSASRPFTDRNAALFGVFQARGERLGVTQAGIGLFAELAAGLVTMASLIWGAFLVIQGNLLLGEMVAGYSLLANMLPSIDRLVRASVVFQEAAVAAARLMDMLLVPSERTGGRENLELREALEVRQGRFAWPNGSVLFDGLDLALLRGRLTGLWGPSGVGKSTLVKILNRTYELSSGAVLVDGGSVDEFSLETYRRRVAVLPERVKIFNGTLADNVLLGRDLADPGHVLEETERLGLHPFLKRFDHGWLTLLGEDERRLSAGERQVVGLLRALVMRPAALIVDEGISSADVELSTLMFDVITEYARDHAVLLISHDLRPLMRADHLYLLESGRIVEQGSPAVLLETSPRFGGLWQLQDAGSRVPFAQSRSAR